MRADRNIETLRMVWNGILIDVSYEANWLNMRERPGQYDVAHLRIESVAPERAPLPITETGSKSHFTSPVTVESFGGPVAFVEAWLDEEGQKPAWRAREQQSRQFALF